MLFYYIWKFFLFQIALAAVTTAVSKIGENLDTYVTEVLFNNNAKQLAILIEAVRSKCITL